MWPGHLARKRRRSAVVLRNVGTWPIFTDDTEHPSAGTGLRRDRLGRGRQARFLVGLDVDLAVDHPAAELQELGPEPLAAPALQGGLADAASVRPVVFG